MKDSLRKEYKVAAQNLWDKDPGAWTGAAPKTENRQTQRPGNEGAGGQKPDGEVSKKRKEENDT